MSARIAPEPVSSTAFTLIADRQSQAMRSPDTSVATAGNDAHREPTPAFAETLPPLPKPPAPPGTMFAAAVMAGALSPKPQTPQEVFLRIGTSWSPPDSDLHLADRTI